MRNVGCKFLFIFILTFTAFASEYDKRAIIITPDLVGGGDSAYSVGDSLVLTGTICAIKISDDHDKHDKKPKCKKIKTDKLEISGFFDNDLKNITNDLVITKSLGVFRYSYTTPPLVAGQTNRFTLIVGKVKSETKKLLKTKAKIYKRIEYINTKIAKYQGDPEKAKNLTFLIDFKATLETVIIKIDKVIAKSPNVLSRLSLPLQVGNDHAAKMFYSTIWGDNKLIIEADTGRPIQGETSTVKTTVFNIGDNHDWFPEFEFDKDDDKKKNDSYDNGKHKKDKKIEFEGYELALSFKGLNLFTSPLFELKRAQEYSHTFTTPRLQPTDLNLIGLSLIEVEKQIEIEDGVEKIEIEKEAKGEFGRVKSRVVAI